MKTLFIFIVSLFLIQSAAFSQVQNPVKWSAYYKAINATEGEVIIEAEIEKGWHTYSQKETDAGPIPTSFKFENTKDYELVGKTKESNAHEEYVKAFEAKIFVFTNKAQFSQKIKTKKPSTIKLQIEYMSCNDLMCLPPKTIDLLVVTKN